MKYYGFISIEPKPSSIEYRQCLDTTSTEGIEVLDHHKNINFSQYTSNNQIAEI